MRNVIAFSTGYVLAFIWVLSYTQPAKAADFAWFASIEAAHQFNGLSSENERRGKKYGNGDNPTATLKFGAEFRFDSIPGTFQTGWKHNSNWLTGWPKNDGRHEDYSESLYLEYKVFGLR